MILLLFITLTFAKVNLITGEITRDKEGYEIEFTSAPDSYLIYNLPKSTDYQAGNELYIRDKCTTCCRVIFATNYDYETEDEFDDAGDINEHQRYVMDMEFDDKRSLRLPNGDYEQNILLRPLNPDNELQYFEFAPYKMYTCYSIPKRVHDIRGGANLGSTLIIWSKNPPLSNLPGTQNQRFVFVHPYPISWYPEYGKSYNYTDDKGRNGTIVFEWPTYQNHFYLPFRYDIHLCYETAKTTKKETWKGNKKLKTLTKSYQISAQHCVPDEPRQMFIPVFA